MFMEARETSVDEYIAIASKGYTIRPHCRGYLLTYCPVFKELPCSLHWFESDVQTAVGFKQQSPYLLTYLLTYLSGNGSC